jgi:uncharacterized protein (TIGR03435 family)
MRLIFPLLLALAAQPQQPPPARPEFEVISIKPGDPSFHGFSFSVPPGRLVARNVRLKFLVTWSYGIRDFQLAGGPGWLASAEFDIDAKLPDGAPSSQAPAMMQAALEDRFQLKIHREARNMREYALVVAPGGPKFRDLDPGDHPGAEGYSGVSDGAIELLGRGKTASGLADLLVSAVGAPVIDQTGLTAKFDYHLKYAPLSVAPGAGDSAPDIFSAIQQLGLKLEPTKGPVPILIIDHAEMPTPN